MSKRSHSAPDQTPAQPESPGTPVETAAAGGIPSEAAMPGREDRIRQRAYELFQTRGSVEGGHDADWFEAERQIDEEDGSH